MDADFNPFTDDNVNREISPVPARRLSCGLAFQLIITEFATRETATGITAFDDAIQQLKVEIREIRGWIIPANDNVVIGKEGNIDISDATIKVTLSKAPNRPVETIRVAVSTITITPEKKVLIVP